MSVTTSRSASSKAWAKSAQGLRPAVAVGLEDTDDAAPSAVARRRQGGAHLGGQMGVVVDEGDPRPLAAELEAAGDSPVATEGGGEVVEGRADLESGGSGGRRVQGALAARDR